eukprot:gene10658-19400_t
MVAAGASIESSFWELVILLVLEVVEIILANRDGVLAEGQKRNLACFCQQRNKVFHLLGVSNEKEKLLVVPSTDRTDHKEMPISTETFFASSPEFLVIHGSAFLIQYASVFPDKFIEREILNATGICENNSAGCPWNGPVKDYEDHISQCPYINITCANQGCGELVPRQFLSQHLETECLYRKEPCQLCGEMVVVANTKKHCQTKCPMAKIKCSQCGKDILRGQEREVGEEEEEGEEGEEEEEEEEGEEEEEEEEKEEEKEEKDEEERKGRSDERENEKEEVIGKEEGYQELKGAEDIDEEEDRRREKGEVERKEKSEK